MSLHGRRVILGFADAGVGIFLALCTILPMAILVFLAFTIDWGQGFDSGLTLEWVAMIGDRFAESITNSLILATCTMVATVVVAGIASYAVVTKRIRAGRLVDGLMMMPLTVSYIVLGLALILTFNKPPLALHGTFWLVLAGHVVITLPLSYRIVLAVLEGVDLNLLEAARGLGAPERTAVRRVILPAIAPGLVAATVLAFVTSLQNYSMSLMVAPEAFKTLPIDLVTFVFSEYTYANYNLAAAASLALMLMIIGALWLVRLITKQTWFENLNF